ncbi:MAG: conjugative transposon protein TraM [Bacteroidota bacterium]
METESPEIIIEQLAEAQQAPKKAERKKWPFLLGGGLVILLLLFGIAYRFLLGELMAPKTTPIPPGPSAEVDLADQRPKGRVEQYQEDLRTRPKREREEAIESDRLDRIAMTWDRIYGQKDEEKGATEPPSPPKSDPARRYEAYRSANQRPSQRKAPTKTVAKTQNEAILARRETAEKALVGFNTISMSARLEEEAQGLITAVTDGEQKVMAGQVIKFRLTQAFMLGEQLVPKNTPAVGICQFGNGRVKVVITQLFLGGEIVPVQLRCFDQDLVEGIAYADPRLKQRSRNEGVNLGDEALDQLLSEIPYAGALLMTGRNVAKERLRDQRVKIRITNNYRVLFKLY